MVIDSKKYAIRTNKYAKNSIAYWFKSRIYTIFAGMI